MVLSMCLTLVLIVYAGGSPVVQFLHFSVKEYLTSSWMLEGCVLRYHIPLEPVHVVVTKACLFCEILYSLYSAHDHGLQHALPCHI